MPQKFKMPIHPREVLRGQRKLFTKAAKESYEKTGEYFQENMRERRFTTQHAMLAGYAPRDPDYIARKMIKMGHNNPLEWSGEAKNASARYRMTSVAGTAKGGEGGYAKLFYYGLRKLNRKTPGQKADMADEFRRIIPQEMLILGDEFNKYLDKKLAEG